MSVTKATRILVSFAARSGWSHATLPAPETSRILVSFAAARAGVTQRSPPRTTRILQFVVLSCKCLGLGLSKPLMALPTKAPLSQYCFLVGGTCSPKHCSTLCASNIKDGRASVFFPVQKSLEQTELTGITKFK